MESTQDSERLKYEEIWRVPGYRRTAPAELEFRNVTAWLEKHAARHVLDFGCGTGRLAKRLADAGYSVRMVDIAQNCLDKSVSGRLGADLTFEVDCLWSDSVAQMRGDAVVCIDVLEHIPEAFVDTVIENLRAAAPHGYVNAALYMDGFGSAIGKRLHMTVKPAGWWHAKFPWAECSVRRNDAWMIW